MMAKSSFRKPGAVAPPTKKAPPQAPSKSPAPKSAAPKVPGRRIPAKAAQFQRSDDHEPPDPEVIPAEVVNEEQPDTDERALALRDPEQPANMMQAPVGTPVGSFDMTDFDTPQLKLAQAVGPVTEVLGFTSGDWVLVLGDSRQEDCPAIILWQEGCAPIEFTVLRFQKKFMQQLDYGTDEMPQLFDTAAQAQAAGLIPFGGHEVGYVPFADVLLVVKRGEGIEDHPAWTSEYNGDTYGLVLWRITGTAYKYGARRILNETRTRLKGGLHTGSFLLEAQKVKGKLNTYWVPQLKQGELHDQAFIDFATNLAGG